MALVNRRLLKINKPTRSFVWHPLNSKDQPGFVFCYWFEGDESVILWHIKTKYNIKTIGSIDSILKLIIENMEDNLTDRLQSIFEIKVK